jgi:Iron-binding zinc finger CDGSH type
MNACASGPLAVHGCRVEGEDLEITTYPSGPTLVRGAAAVRGPDGRTIAVRRRATAICRCGKSRLAPLCDGTHRFVPGFEPVTFGAVPEG